MSGNSAKLHMFCGKIASGKSTLAAQLAQGDKTVLIAEDAWLSALYGDQMATLADYVRCSAKMRDTIGPHVIALLNAGVTVVLDFPANTGETRQWMRGILDATNVAHTLHVLDSPDALCLQRLHARNAVGDHPFAATEAQFHQVSKHFQPPSAEEGFTIQIHDVGG